MKKILIYALVIAGILYFISAFNNKTENGKLNLEEEISEVTYRDVKYPQVKAQLAGAKLDLAVAHTPELRGLGLSGVEELGDNEGMLFIFEEAGKNGFWMKDMLMSIDMIFVDSDGKVVLVEENVSPDTFPESFGSETESRYVIELAAGRAGEIGVVEGSEFKLVQ